ncbi:MAG: hypothetical protein ACO3JL_06680 [Myxococcota bacterium]
MRAVSLCLLGWLSAMGAQATPRSSVEGGLTLEAAPAIDAARSELRPLMTLRGARLWTVGGHASSWLAGADVRLLLETGPRTRGTASLSGSSYDAALESRGLLGRVWGDAPLSCVTYVFGGPNLGARLGWLQAFDTQALRVAALYGMRAGLGTELRLGAITASSEFGGGAGERGLELVASLSVGVGF